GGHAGWGGGTFVVEPGGVFWAGLKFIVSPRNKSRSISFHRATPSTRHESGAEDSRPAPCFATGPSRKEHGVVIVAVE
ncbi:MAG: hypothetical protein VYA35_06540, partial [Pseudomonadota bacterium]|nr:hypothetical protein [Pseudomonadota bacterium]